MRIQIEKNPFFDITGDDKKIQMFVSFDNDLN